jgi:hypothetical protein
MARSRYRCSVPSEQEQYPVKPPNDCSLGTICRPLPSDAECERHHGPRDHKQDCISFRSIRGSLHDAVGTFRLGDGYQNGFTRVSIVAMRYVEGGYALFTSRVLA